MEEDERFLIAILSLLDAILVSFLGVWMLSKPQEVHDTLPAVLAFVTFLHAIKMCIRDRLIRCPHEEGLFLKTDCRPFPLGRKGNLIYRGIGTVSYTHLEYVW